MILCKKKIKIKVSLGLGYFKNLKDPLIFMKELVVL
jgi:hypothetical protein